MKTRQFGFTNIKVSELCFATSAFAQHVDQGAAFAMLDAFHEAGGNFVQTAGARAMAHSAGGFVHFPDEFLGRWLDSRGIARREIVIAAVFGIAPFTGEEQLPGDHLALASLRETLQRIGTNYVDLAVLPWRKELLPLRDSMGAVERLVATGGAQHALLAGFPTEYLEVARQYLHSTLAGLELEYSLLNRSAFLRGPSSFCRENNLGFLARSPLAGGHLVAWPAPTRGRIPPVAVSDPYIASSAHALWPALSRLARAHDCSPAQVAVAWALAQSDVSSVRISTHSPAQLRELLESTKLQLSADELAELEAESTGGLTPEFTCNHEPIVA